MILSVCQTTTLSAVSSHTLTPQASTTRTGVTTTCNAVPSDGPTRDPGEKSNEREHDETEVEI